MYIRQRVNHLILYRRVEIIEQTVVKPAFFASDRKIVFHKHYPFGADFYASWIYIFLNSIWITLGVFLALHHQEITTSKSIEITFFSYEAGVFITAFILQETVRRLILCMHKKADFNLKKEAIESRRS